MTPTIENASAMPNNDAKSWSLNSGITSAPGVIAGTSQPRTHVQDRVEMGKVRFLFEDFPINDLSDRASSMAAEASYFAGDYGKFWEDHDKLHAS